MGKRLLQILIIIFLFSACRDKYLLKIGTFPEGSPINLVDLNSEFDEMNSDYVSPFLSAQSLLIFSSNAPSSGENFDLDARLIQFNQSKETGSFSFNVSKVMGQSEVIRNQLFEINSDCDERGPYSLDGLVAGVFVRLFSRECEGFSKIYYNEYRKTGSFDYQTETKMLTLEDSESSEMYPSLYGKGFLKGDLSGNSQGIPEKLIFGSDKDGQLDIYEAEIPTKQTVYEFVSDPRPKQVRKLPISSDFDDQMPFVYGDLLVFSSNRPGGFGGFDLYFSERVGNQWAEPVNFGPEINSEFDEYRPIVSDHLEYGNRLMIFSSNRPGGMGGFDLYFVGIEKF